MIHCLLVSGIPLNDSIRNLLFDTAQEMFSTKTERKNVSCEWCEGYVSTTWKTKSVGYIYGKEFIALIETDWGKVEVSYIVVESDLRSRNGVWVSVKEHSMPPAFSDN